MYGEMDEEMEDFDGDDSEAFQVDSDYEFDATRFFDFTRPESSSEAKEAERWFESAGGYPPSPFIIKLKWREGMNLLKANASLESNDGESILTSGSNLDGDMDSEVYASDESRKGSKSHNDMDQDISETKKKSKEKSSKIRGSTLMKPTASHLAKLNQAKEVHPSRLSGRSQKPLTTIDGRSSRNSLRIDGDATKRQKLENGYLRKVARLKHQNLLLHKLSMIQRLNPNTVSSRPKVTVPREPNLETAHRALRHRSRTNSETGELAKTNTSTFKARPLNRKMLNAPPLPPQKKSRPQSPAFQEFHLRTSERALQHSRANAPNMLGVESVSRKGSTGTERISCEDAQKQEKCETVNRVKAYPHSKKIIISKRDVSLLLNVREEVGVPLELKLPNDNRLSCNPPVELFNKLSLESEVEHNTISQSKAPLHTKGSKENMPASFNRELRAP